MKNYNIVFHSSYTKDTFCNFLRKNYIAFNTSEYYDNGYYITVSCTAATADEINNYLDSLLTADTEY